MFRNDGPNLIIKDGSVDDIIRIANDTFNVTVPIGFDSPVHIGMSIDIEIEENYAESLDVPIPDFSIVDFKWQVSFTSTYEYALTSYGIGLNFGSILASRLRTHVLVVDENLDSIICILNENKVIMFDLDFLPSKDYLIDLP